MNDSQTANPTSSVDAPDSGADVNTWDPENKEFWESKGQKIASRNLWISIPSLLCGFAIWLYWGIITVQMLNLGFPFAKSELFTLIASHKRRVASVTNLRG